MATSYSLGFYSQFSYTGLLYSALYYWNLLAQ